MPTTSPAGRRRKSRRRRPVHPAGASRRHRPPRRRRRSAAQPSTARCRSRLATSRPVPRSRPRTPRSRRRRRASTSSCGCRSSTQATPLRSSSARCGGCTPAATSTTSTTKHVLRRWRFRGDSARRRSARRRRVRRAARHGRRIDRTAHRSAQPRRPTAPVKRADRRRRGGIRRACVLVATDSVPDQPTEARIRRDPRIE